MRWGIRVSKGKGSADHAKRIDTEGRQHGGAKRKSICSIIGRSSHYTVAVASGGFSREGVLAGATYGRYDSTLLYSKRWKYYRYTRTNQYKDNRTIAFSPQKYVRGGEAAKARPPRDHEGGRTTIKAYRVRASTRSSRRRCGRRYYCTINPVG